LDKYRILIKKAMI